jgi:glycosyltransferase involved in cell wall biosynthesis
VKPTKPRIVHVVEAFGGGVFESVAQICNLLADSHSFTIIHAMRPETPSGYKSRFPEDTHFIELPSKRSIGFSDIKAIHFLRRTLKDIGPAFIHAHSSKAGALTRLAALGLGKPVAYSPRSYAFLMSSSKRLTRAIYLTLEIILGQLPATTIACGHDEAHIARFITPRVTTVANAVDASKTPFKVRTFKSPLRIVATGRTSPQKGFDAFLRYAANSTNLPITFTWVGGPIPEGTTIPPNVKITGWIPHDRVRTHFDRAHAFLSLSRWEGLPRAALEAMAGGLPVILSDIAGHRELVTPKTGFLCRSLPEFRNAIQTWLNNTELLAHQSTAARRHIEAGYDRPLFVANLKNLYSVES